MRCPNCGYEDVKEILMTKALKDRKGNPIVIDKLPTISCENCGVLLYSAKTLQMMDNIIDHPEHMKKRTVKYVKLAVA